MDAVRQHLLARTGLAGQEHADIASGHAADQAVQREHRVVEDDRAIDHRSYRGARAGSGSAGSGRAGWRIAPAAAQRSGPTRCRIDDHQGGPELRDLAGS
jgi:hypothetical protein